MKAASDGVYLGFSFSESASNDEFSMKSSTCLNILRSGAFWYGCDPENPGRIILSGGYPKVSSFLDGWPDFVH